jgi:hypothetical protein
MLAATRTRVAQATADAVNEDIRRGTAASVAGHAAAGETAVARRLGELDREWDIERVLEANAATITLLGLGLGATVSRRFYLLPAVVAGFLLQHALQGWCPPVPFFRRRGVRTPAEIGHERYALKALRGDFRGVDGDADARAALAAAER